MTSATPPPDIAETVARALQEDIGTGDLSAQLIDGQATIRAEIRCREDAVLCGCPWADQVFRQLDRDATLEWEFSDGDRIPAGSTVCTINGNTRAILSGERTALNFLQLLSGTATAAAQLSAIVADTPARILDTRKTVPGLRLAQKYAVVCGGAENHRTGLFDAILLKENHIAAVGSLAKAVELAYLQNPDVMIEVEVETLAQLEEALDTAADRIMLDNFSPDQIREAIAARDRHSGPRKELEASGAVEAPALRAIAETGIDLVSVGALTKHVRAVDFSMRCYA